MPAYDYSSSTAVKMPSGRGETIAASLDLRGLDLVTPVDLIKDGHTPYAQNFRLYAQQTDDRRVTVSSRKGPGHYTTPIGHVLVDSNVATTGASTANVGVIIGTHAQPYVATSNNRLTRVDFQLANLNSAAGPIKVQVYSDDAGKPAKLLTESGLLNGDILGTQSYVIARFLNAIKLVSGTKYWFVLSIQDDGKNTYTFTTTTAGTKAYKTDSNLSQLALQTYSLNYKIYTSIDQVTKGAYRFNRDNGQNITVANFGTDMYKLDEATKTWISILPGLNSNASDYSFTNGDNKVFWVNGYDELTAWNGQDELTASNTVTNPSFTVAATGYTAIAGSTASRVTSDFNTTPASLQVTAASGIRGTILTQAVNRDHRYKISYYTKGSTATGNTFVTVNGGTTALTGSTKALTTAWAKNEFYYTPTSDLTTIEFKGSSDNFFIDDVSIVDTGIEYIRDLQLPILSQILMHKDRLWGVVAADPNKLVFSENPGNPAFDPTGAIPTTAREQWYYAWLSVSFWYVPRPHNGSPITAIVSFQDALTVFTQDNKYVLSGYDRGSLNLRQSTGNKGALSYRGVAADENNIFFVSNDGFYSYNGSADTKISALINPMFDGCGQKEKITPVLWKQEVRFYMASPGSSVNDTCVIYNKDFQEMEFDTDTFIDRAIYYGDADDDQQLVEFSSLIPNAFFAEQDYTSLGGPIDFEYRFKYDSLGAPAQKKRLKKYFPLLQGVDSSFEIQLAMDKDFQNSPRIKDVLLTVNGSKWGEFNWGDGTLFGNDTSFKQHRQSFSGYAYYWQLRIARKGILNRVAFIGAQYSYKTKRL